MTTIPPKGLDKQFKILEFYDTLDCSWVKLAYKYSNERDSNKKLIILLRKVKVNMLLTKWQ